MFPSLNHLFIYDPDGSPLGYQRLTHTAVEQPVVGMAVDWLVKRLK